MEVENKIILETKFFFLQIHTCVLLIKLTKSEKEFNIISKKHIHYEPTR